MCIYIYMHVLNIIQKYTIVQTTMHITYVYIYIYIYIHTYIYIYIYIYVYTYSSYYLAA